MATYYGSSGNDTLSGTAGDDTIVAGLGNDFINGSEGSDSIFAGYDNSASQWRYGFTDNETVDYRGLSSMYIVAMQFGTVLQWDVFSPALVGTDRLSGVDNLSGTDFDDTLSGRDYWDFETFRGYFGNNTIDGRGGNDGVDYSWLNPGLFGSLDIQLASGTTSFSEDGGGSGNDQLRQIELITGSQGNDTFNAQGYGATSTNRNSLGEDYNIYNPLGGNDLIFGNGSTILGLAGAAGRLTVDLSLLTDSTTATYGVVGFSGATGAGGSFTPGQYYMSGIAQVRGGAYADMLLGGGRTNSNGSATTVSGDNSFEGFRGAGGSDYIDGRTGFDLADYAVGNQSQGISVNLAAGTVSGDPLLTGEDALRGIESITGTYGDDFYSAWGFTLSNAVAPSDNSGDVIATAPAGETLASNAFNEFRVLAGNDLIDGNGATRISFQGLLIEPPPFNEWSVDISFTSASAGSGTYGGQTLQIPGGSLGRVDFTGTYAIRGSAAADHIIGVTGFQQLAGYYGNDELFGGDGADVLYGHLGGDGAAQNLSNNFSDDDKLYGGAGNDLLRGDFGADTLDGGTGNDRMEGGTEDDDYFVDSVADVVIELAGPASGFDRLYTSVSYTVPDNVESLFLTGAAAINATGNAQNNYLSGNAAANVLNGGGGADSMYGGQGNDTYVVDSGLDRMYEFSATVTEIDTERRLIFTDYEPLADNVENLVLASWDAFFGKGNSLNNVITGFDLYSVLN